MSKNWNNNNNKSSASSSSHSSSGRRQFHNGNDNGGGGRDNNSRPSYHPGDMNGDDNGSRDEDLSFSLEDCDLFPFGKADFTCALKALLPDPEDPPLSLTNVLNLVENNGSKPSSVLPPKGSKKTEEERFQDLFRHDNYPPEEDKSSSSPPPLIAPPSSESTAWDRTHLLNLIGNEDVLEAVVSTINSDKKNDEIQEHLFDLLGFDQLDLIMLILTNRDVIMRTLSKEEAVAQAVRNHMKNVNSSQSHPVIGVKVQSVEEKYLEKVYRKEEKKAFKKGVDMPQQQSSSTYEAEVGVAQSMRSKMQKAAASTLRFTGGYTSEFSPGDLPNVFDSYAEAKQMAGFISGVKMVLPVNATRKDSSTHEEVYIPPSKVVLPDHIAERPLIQISDLDPIPQLVFHGMKSLNRIQSIVFETAYKTNENLLICAPTGAGKTNIALLAVLHCIQDHIEAGVIKKDQFKIIYVAPMKALAAEMTANFSKRLSPLGIQVKELTGDMQLTKSEIAMTQMLVTTPEKWDVVTRKSTGDVALAQIVKLLIIDEVHLLHGDRGPVVESLVARTLRQVESSQRMIRIVGLSATLPNYVDVARFLRVSLRVGLFYFDSRFRPVPLGQTFIGVKPLSIQEQNRQMDECCHSFPRRPAVGDFF